MKIRQFLDQIEDHVRDRVTKELPVDRWELLDYLSNEVRILSGKFRFNWAASILRPAVKTKADEREYILPENFGLNFIPGGDQSENFTVTLSDGTNESPLRFISSERFYAMNLEAESSGRPSQYTIITDPTSSRRKIVLSTIPDSNSDSNYGVNGMYVPTDWSFESHDLMLPVPNNSDLLEQRILMRVFENRDQQRFGIHAQMAQNSMDHLLLQVAQSKRHRFIPRLSRDGWRNSYKVVR